MNRYPLFFALWLTWLTAITPVQAREALGQPQAIPSTVYVAADRPATFTVTWRVPVSIGPLSSSAGSFEPALGTFPLALNQSALAGTTALITENVRVPLAVIQKALAGGSSFIYRRVFQDGGVAAVVMASADVTVKITGAQAAGLSATRQAIAFDDNAPVRIVTPRQVLGAWSEVTLSGTGLVEGVWEIAEPPTTSGQVVFRNLRVVRQFAQSSVPLRLDSPLLPTSAPGLYLLRLRLTQPQPGFDPPEIRYFVAQPGAAPVARELNALSPQPGALLDEHTRFAWAPLDGVQSWLLVLYRRPTGLGGNLPELGAAALPEAAELAQLARAAPVAGILVPGSQSGVALSALARNRLEAGNAYLWRVLGLSKDGVVLGETTWRVVRVP